LLSVCVVVTAEYFTNVTNVVISNQVTLSCPASRDTTAVWYYQQYCEHFVHGMYVCSNPTEIFTGTERQYRMRVNAPGEHSLLINGVTKNMTGLYTCKDQNTDYILYSVFLVVICKYISVLSFACICQWINEKVCSIWYYLQALLSH